MTKIYVVDDDRYLTNALHRLLRSAGFEVETFNSAREFLTNFVDGDDTCLVLDLRMPEIGGLELLQQLRSKPIDLPVIIYTGNADVAATVKAMQIGAYSVIEKPFSDELMIAEIRNAIAAGERTRPRQRMMREAQALIAGLSERERALVPLLGDGATAREVAETLGLSVRTVEAHRANIFKKLGINHSAALVRLALLAELEAERHPGQRP